MTDVRKNNHTLYYSLFVSVVAMAVERLVIHPVETVYLTQQKNKTFFIKAAYSIWSKKGGLAFYSGLKPMLYSALPLNMSIFGVYTAILTEMERREFTYTTSNITAGVACAFSSSLVLSPTETIRLRKTYEMPDIKPSFEALFKKVIKPYYCGYHFVLVRMLLFGTLTLSGSNAINRRIDPLSRYPWLPYLSTFGMGIFTTVATTLIDNVRIQQFIHQDDAKRISPYATYRQLLKEGLLFNGLIPRWTRFTVGPAIIMGTTQLLLK